MRKHEALFTAKWVAQETRKAATKQELDNLSFSDVPIVQPAALLRSPITGADAPTRKDGVADLVPLQHHPRPVNKYGNRPSGGYASAKEAKRAAELKLLEKAGAIRNLREQVPFVLIPAQVGERECRYIADFCYEEEPREPGEHGWRLVVEDVKGFKTDLYRLKKKLLRYMHSVVIKET